jgi:hypothetical protein
MLKAWNLLWFLFAGIYYLLWFWVGLFISTLIPAASHVYTQPFAVFST